MQSHPIRLAWNLAWMVEDMMHTIGLAGTVLLACVAGILLGAAGIDLETLARMTAVLSFLTILTFGVRAVYHHKTAQVTAIVGVGIAQGILYFFTDVQTSILSIMCDAMMICTVIYLTKKRKWI